MLSVISNLLRAACLCPLVLSTVGQEDTSYIDTSGSGSLVFGQEELVTDVAIMTSGAETALPPVFTICSSLLTSPLPTMASFFSLSQEDGSPWLALALRSPPDSATLTHRMDFTVRSRGRFSVHHYHHTSLPVVPEAWLTGCLAVDTTTGQVEVVAGGRRVASQVLEQLKDSADLLPRSLKGKLVLGKLDRGGYWYQARSRVAGLTLYSSALGTEELEEATIGCGGGRGDLLGWSQMRWRLEGEAREGQVARREVCRPPSSLLVLTAKFQGWGDCMAACPRMGGSRVPEVITPQQTREVLEEVRDLLTDPATGQAWSSLPGLAFWLPVSDSEVEGEWRDWYTGRLASPGWVEGRPVEATDMNCAIAVLEYGGAVDFTCHAGTDSQLVCIF